MGILDLIRSKKYTNERVTELTGLDLTSVNTAINNKADKSEVDELTTQLASITSKTPWALVHGTDANSIQSAINSLPASGGTVYFLNVTHTCNTAINFNKSNVKYVGTKGTLLVSTIDGMPFNITGTDIDFENIGFKHDIASTVYGVTLDVGANVKRLNIEKCRFYGLYGRVNISNLGISDVTIDNCYFEQCAYGILVNANSSDMRRLNITNNTFLNTLGDSIELNTPNVRGVGLKEVVVTGNVIQRDLRYMVANGISLGDSTNQNVGHAIGSSGLSDAIISNNVIDGYYFAGIDLEDESERVIITGNKIKNCYGDAPDWATGKSYKKDDMVKSNNYIYLAQTSGTSGATAPAHTTGELSDGGVTWLYLTPKLNSSPSFPTGINVQDANFITIGNNLCERTGFAGIVLENRQGYSGSDDNIGNTYVATISDNVIEKCVNGLYVATDGKCEISITGNTCSLNSNAGIYVKRTTSSISYNDNMLAENTYGFYLDEVYTEAIFTNNVLSKNTTPIGLSASTFRGGARFNKLTGFASVNTTNGTNTGNQSMFSLGKYAKGTVSLMSRSNVNDYVCRMWEITWDGTTLTQTQTYSFVNGAVGSAAITMVGDVLACSLTNNGATGNVDLSLVFDGICIIR